ncbi:MAG: hypothetical protein IT437_11805 [Phycisphaerales bacterium]|nr:hypothetical protein [Phycisphaerales bacterium]
MWREAQAFKLPPGYVYEWDVLWYPVMTDAELAATIAEVGTKPDHPKRAAMEEDQRRRRNGPDKSERRLYYLDAHNWRLNDSNLAEGTFNDVVNTDVVQWVLTRHSLAILDPGTPAPPHRNYTELMESSANAIGLFAFGGLGGGASEGWQPLRASMRGSSLSGRFGGAGSEFEYIGDIREGQIRLESSRLLASAQRAEWVGRSFQFSEFAREPAFSREIAHRVKHLNPDGRPRVERLLRAIRPLTEAEFDRLSPLPEPGKMDAIRGDVKFTTVGDFRPGAETLTTKTPGGDRVDPIPTAQLGRPPAASLRQMGWWGVAAVIAALVGIRVWRHSRAT